MYLDTYQDLHAVYSTMCDTILPVGRSILETYTMSSY